MTDDAVRLAVIGKLGWIKRQQAGFLAQQRQSPREMVSGESHYFLGRRYRLQLIEQDGSPGVIVKNTRYLTLSVQPGTPIEKREQILQCWYRAQLRELIPPLVAKWQARLGVQASGWGIRKMKTKWGSCHGESRRVWFNLELAKKPVQCIEYIVAHELAHLQERHHNERFVSLLDQTIPQWRLHRAELNQAPLPNEKWNHRMA